MILTWVAAIAMMGADPVYSLDNGVIRVEVDPRVFAIRFVGFRDAANFVAPLPVDAAALEGSGWVDAGGLQTDLIPYTGKDAATRRGPAEVVEYRSDYIAMMGPVSEALGVRVKKEIQLQERTPRARFRVTVQRAGAEPGRYAIRNTVRLNTDCTLRTERTDGEIKALAGVESIFPSVVKSRRYWLIPIPPTSETHSAILGAMAPRVITVNDSGTWTRKLLSPPTDPSAVPSGSTLLCLLDDATKSYAVALQGAALELAPGAIATLEEEWDFEKRGK